VTGPLPGLPAFPANAAVPSPAQRLAIDAALTQADLLIAAFLGAGNRDAYLDAVFGNVQRAAALANFQAMRQVVGRWQNQTRDVYVSAWLTQFNRGATTNGRTQRLTLPIADLANRTAPQLGRTIVHESAHGVSNAIIDMAYGGPAFIGMLGATRLYNAPHYDFTTNAFHAGTAPGAVAAGNPNAVAVAAGPGAQLAPAAGAQLGRAQMLITHARIHAENMLEEMVRCIRTGQTSQQITDLADGMRPAAAAPLLDPADATRANQIVQALSTLHGQSGPLTHALQQGGAPSAAVAGGVVQMTFGAGPAGGADFTQRPVRGDLTADPWLQRVVNAILAAYPPAPAAGITADTLARIDRQYHRARDDSAH
jgi:hypothetical protein